MVPKFLLPVTCLYLLQLRHKKGTLANGAKMKRTFKNGISKFSFHNSETCLAVYGHHATMKHWLSANEMFYGWHCDPSMIRCFTQYFRMKSVVLPSYTVWKSCSIIIKIQLCGSPLPKPMLISLVVFTSGFLALQAHILPFLCANHLVCPGLQRKHVDGGNLVPEFLLPTTLLVVVPILPITNDTL